MQYFNKDNDHTKSSQCVLARYQNIGVCFTSYFYFVSFLNVLHGYILKNYLKCLFIFLLFTGAQGSIFIAANKITGQSVVLKKIPPTQPRINVKNEIKASKLVGRHPNLSFLIEDVKDLGCDILIFERVDAIEMLTWLIRNDFSPRSEPEARAIILQLLSALQHVHSKNIAHRDIKLEVQIDRIFSMNNFVYRIS